MGWGHGATGKGRLREHEGGGRRERQQRGAAAGRSSRVRTYRMTPPEEPSRLMASASAVATTVSASSRLMPSLQPGPRGRQEACLRAAACG